MHAISSTELLRAARENHRAGRPTESEALYRRAIELDPANIPARLNLAIVLHELTRPVEAAELLGQLLVDHPTFPAAWVQLARVIEPQGFAWEAHNAIAKALKANPDAETLVSASGLLLKMRDVTAAESTARRALELAPTNADAWFQLGQVLTVKGEAAEAAAAYRQALTHDPANAVAAFSLAAASATAENIPPPPAAPPDYVRTLFDDYAERFDSALVGSLEYRTPQILEQMFSRWNHRTNATPMNSITMLDAGCGTGLCAIWLSKYRGRLVGIDLSRGMIAKAQAHNVYDELIVGEIVHELEKRPATFDLIVAADVFVYLGDLTRAFTAADAALRPGGVLLFSVEANHDTDFRLLPTRRFAHSMPYLNRLAASSNLTVRETQQAVIRLEKGVNVPGHLMLVQKT